MAPAKQAASAFLARPPQRLPAQAEPGLQRGRLMTVEAHGPAEEDWLRHPTTRVRLDRDAQGDWLGPKRH